MAGGPISVTQVCPQPVYPHFAKGRSSLRAVKMLLSKRDFRAMMYYEYVRGTGAEECQKALAGAFGECAPELLHVTRAYREFERTSAFAKGKIEAPRIRAVTTEYVDAARRIVRTDPRIRLSEAAGLLNVDSSVARTILEDYLGLTKRWQCWVPKELTQENKKDRLEWCNLMLSIFENGCSETVENIVVGGEIWLYRCKFGKETKGDGEWIIDAAEDACIIDKRPTSCFFARRGYLTTLPLDPKLSRVTVAWLADTYLPRLSAAWKPTSKEGQELCLHHERTQEITAARIVRKLHELDARLLPHPWHSPDLAPVDYFLLPRLSRALRGRRFADLRQAIDACQKHFDDGDSEIWRQAFADWFCRIKRCSRSAEGGYFDGLSDVA